MTQQNSFDWVDCGILSLFRSPFMIPSLIFHTVFFLLAWGMATFTMVKPDEAPISVQLLELGSGRSPDKSIGPGKGPGGPRTTPKRGTSVVPVQRTGKLDSGSRETSVPSKEAAQPAPPPKPAPLPGPKLLADGAPGDSVSPNETSPDALVQLPTRDAPTRLPGSSAIDLEANSKSHAALKDSSQLAGIQALKEGTQIPGALKGGGLGTSAYGVPGGSRTGSGVVGGGTGVGSGGGSLTGLRGRSGADYNQYLNQLKRRVQSVWKYPEGVSGVQKVAILFTLDRAGRLVRSEVLESTDARLNASAVEAMKRAAPFPPIPDSLKDLANTPLRMQFTVTIGVRG